jgi:hypothetical protein
MFSAFAVYCEPLREMQVWTVEVDHVVYVVSSAL